jgi:hypothetical protein
LRLTLDPFVLIVQLVALQLTLVLYLLTKRQSIVVAGLPMALKLLNVVSATAPAPPVAIWVFAKIDFPTVMQLIAETDFPVAMWPFAVTGLPILALLLGKSVFSVVRQSIAETDFPVATSLAPFAQLVLPAAHFPVVVLTLYLPAVHGC